MSREWIQLVSSVILRTWQLSLTSQWKWGQFQSSSELESQRVSCICLWNYCFKESSSRITTLASCLSKAPALIKPKEQSNDGQLASVLKLVPWSVILSFFPRKREMAVIQYEKRPALTLQKISICRQGHNVITKVFIPESDWGDNSFKALTYIPRKTFPATEEKIARYFDSIKKVPSSSALSSSSGSSKRKRGSNNEKTPRKGSRIKRDSKQTVLEQQSDSLQEKVVECVRRREYST